MTAPDRMLNDAIRLHEAGRIAEASDLYRKLLAQQPSNADALHLLGVAEHQSGRRDAALQAIDGSKNSQWLRSCLARYIAASARAINVCAFVPCSG